MLANPRWSKGGELADELQSAPSKGEGFTSAQCFVVWWLSMYNLYWLEEPVAKAGTTTDAVRLHVLCSFKGFFGR